MYTSQDQVHLCDLSSLSKDDLMVDHLQHPLALWVRALLDRSRRQLLEKFIIDDAENIIQALKSGIVFDVMFSTDVDQLPDSLKHVMPDDLPVASLSKRTAKKIFGGDKVSRLFAIAAQPEPHNLSHLNDISGDLMVLDALSLTGNVGAIIRTSVAFGVGAIVLLDSEPVDHYDRRVIRASRGHVFDVPVISCVTSDFMQYCQQQAVPILVTSSHSTESVEDVVMDAKKMAIVLGSEKRGCDHALMQAATYHACIPMADAVESLNVSVAASIILYLRQLRARGYQLST